MTAHLTELGKHVRDEAALRNSVLPQVIALMSGESSLQNLPSEMVGAVKEIMVRASVGTVQQLIPTHFAQMWQCANILSPQRPGESAHPTPPGVVEGQAAEGGTPDPRDDAILDEEASVSSIEQGLGEPTSKIPRLGSE